MGILRDIAGRIRIPLPLTGTSGNTPVAFADKIRSLLAAATDGNSVDDHLSDLIARIGHNAAATTAYSNSATYAVGDEVYWIDGNSRKRFFKRLTAGDDGGSGTPVSHADAWDEIGVSLHNLAVEGSDRATLDAVLVRHPTTGQIIFTTAVQEELNRIAADYQNAAAVQALIDVTAGRLADTVRWRGAYSTSVEYQINDYAEFNGTYYRRLTAGTDNSGDPTTRTRSWVAVTGVERLIVQRLRDVETLVTSAIEVPAAQANRGMWLARLFGSEGWNFVRPPMQWRDAWAANRTYYYGHAVSHVGKAWVLSALGTIVTGKTGSGTAPGTDAAWTELPFGYPQDYPRIRDEWDRLGGETFRVHDVVPHNDSLYETLVEHTRTNAGPETDSTNFRLLTLWQGPYASGRAFHAGSEVTHGGQIWKAFEDVANGDPAPGASGNTKWRQITGASDQADIDALRNEIENLAHGVFTTRGLLVDALPTPITDDTESPIWLPRRATAAYSVPAALHPGNADTTFTLGHEAGEYAIATGTPNRLSAVLERRQEGSVVWYGALTRAGQGGPWNFNVGKMLFDGLGSAVMGVGIRQLSATSGFLHLVMKKALHDVWGEGTIHIKMWDHEGTRLADMSVSEDGRWHEFTHGGVTYVNLAADIDTETGPIQTIAGAATEAARTVTIAFSRSANGNDLYLGNSNRAWLLQPPIASRDAVPVYSEDVHDIVVLEQDDFEALPALEPRTHYLTHTPAGS